MSSRRLFLQSLMGHLSLLERKYPRKASSELARRTKQVVKTALKAA